ncbi:MAG: hypothetical protein Q9M22_06045 [Mariprofundaceae bacterium]|nr:hypothetical protein [Mariprofundaceae bacterium]
MQKNNNVTFFSENSMADVLQQEIAQRLLAIRMNAALYSRRNEGRETQQLANQAVCMTDEIIRHFESLLSIMRLPKLAFDQGIVNAVSVLQKDIESMGASKCIFHVPQELEKLSSSDAFFLFQIVHGIVLQFMLDAKKGAVITVELKLDTKLQQCVMTACIPDGDKQLLFLRETLKGRIVGDVNYNSESSKLHLTVPVSGLA